MREASWRIASDVLADLASGGPVILAAPGVSGLEDAPLPVLVLAGDLLTPLGPIPEGELLPLSTAPGRVLACLAPDEAQPSARARALAEGWAALGGTMPLFLAAQDLASAMPTLAHALAAALAESEAGRFEAEAALAALREEAEETRIALAAAMRVFGNRLPPPPVAALNAEASADESVAGGTTALRQPLGLPVEGICGIEIHCAGPGAGGLRARLRAEESDRVLAAWEVPVDALRPGWLALDLPQPLPPIRESAVLELLSDMDPGPAFALEAGTVEPEGALSGHQDRALALRVWTAPPGGRFALPMHYDWAASGLPALPSGVPLPVGSGIWAAAQLPDQVELVGLGAEAPRALVRLSAGSRALLKLPALPPGPADLVRLEVALRDGPAAAIAFGLWLQPERDDGTLQEAGPGCRWSGWRWLDAEGRGEAVMPLPPGARRIVLDFAGMDADTVVEVASLSLLRGAEGERRREPRLPLPALPVIRPAPAPVPRPTPVPGAFSVTAPPAPAAEEELPATGPVRVAAPMPAEEAMLGLTEPLVPRGAALLTAPSFDDLRLHQHLVNGDGSYRHLDVTLEGLASGAGLWKQVRFKLFERRGVVGLEFRSMRGWPAMFDPWPGKGKDAHGPFWRVETEGAAAALEEVAPGRDRALIATLLAVLPGAANRAALAGGLPGEEAEAWVRRAERLVEATQAPGAT